MRSLSWSIVLAAACAPLLPAATACRAAEPPASQPAEAFARGDADDAADAEALALLPPDDRGPVRQALLSAGDRHGQWAAALREAPAEQRGAVAFLLANMPERDLASLDKDFLLENVALAYEQRASRPWGKQVPEEVFRDAVLPYASLNEHRERWRGDFARRFAPLVKDCKTPSEAALALNAGIFKQVNVQYHPTKRPKPDQSPSESIAAGYASCSGLSILLVDACRAVGVPARVVGTPAWAVHKGDANGNHGGNHTWLEIWDHQWHVLGAIEVAPLDQTWFLPNASQALGAVKDGADADDHHIYAACARKTGTTFSLVWDSSIRYVNAEDVTAAYAGRTAVKMRLEAPAASTQPALAHVTLRQQGRLVADLDIEGAATLILSAGQQYEAAVDTGTHSSTSETLVIPKEKDPTVTLKTSRRTVY